MDNALVLSKTVKYITLIHKYAISVMISFSLIIVVAVLPRQSVLKMN
jgi:hypothetical protein